MKHRLYFMLPSVESARELLDKLLIARIEIHQMHFHAKEGALLPDMPQASLIQRTALVRGAETGVVTGACSGFMTGSLFLLFPPEELKLGFMLLIAAVIGGSILGSWLSAQNSTGITNAKLQPFRAEVEAGQVLLMVDVGLYRIKEIEDLVAQKHPDAVYRGVDDAAKLISWA